MPDAHRSSLSPVGVFTDGACIGNPGKGGWAWAVSGELYESGFELHTTNQRMEVTAVLRAVRALPGRLHVVSDSTYVVNCFRQRWWRGWLARGWRNSRGEPVANQDLWRQLIDEVTGEQGGRVEFSWVKGHSGNPMNDLVDSLANEAARSQRGTAGTAVAVDGADQAVAAPDWAADRLFP